jgi:hypothetical protein
MGRVAKKRKIKQCDPYFKGRREMHLANESKYDLDPTDVVSNRKKLKRKKAANLERIESQVTSRCTVVKAPPPQLKSKRVAGEAFGSFCKRVGREVKQILIDETQKSFRSHQKKKDYFAKKKHKQQKLKMSDQERYEEDFKGAEVIRFGDRVDAPPTIPAATLRRLNNLKK